MLVEYRKDEDGEVSALSVDDQALNRLLGSAAGRMGLGLGCSLMLVRDVGRGLFDAMEDVGRRVGGVGSAWVVEDEA